MRKGWKSKNVGKCLTEYLHPRYHDLVGQFHAFASFSQFEEDHHGKKIGQVKVNVKEEPVCSGGHVLYGITKIGRLIALKSVIDSSD